MGKIAQLTGPSLAWARAQFAAYYRSATPAPPERFARREFAAFPFASETLMRRHASFRTEEEFRAFVAREVPRHLYYSSAYYRLPDHPQMAGKEWLGADLIFDLDADHLRGAERLDYPGQLALVKERVAQLLDDFLLGDFGVDPATTQLVFSGGRGYHVHVRDERFLTLGSAERRDLVEYVMGVGFDPTAVVERRREATSGAMTLLAGAEDGEGGAGGRRGSPAFKRLPAPDAPGWRGRTTRAVLALLARWERDGADAATEELVAAGTPPATARRLVRAVLGHGRAEQIRRSLSLEVFRGEVPKELVPILFTRAAVAVQGETDAPVTTDIHRLIRLPGSLHGGTGLRVVPLAREELEAFDPLRDAIIPPVGEGDVTVELAESVDARLGDAHLAAAAGTRHAIPRALALFLVLRGEAAIPVSPGS